MKIVSVVQRYFPVLGGSEIYTKKLVDFLSIRNEVSVYTTSLNDIKGLWNKNTPKVEQNVKTKYPVHRCDIITPEDIPRNLSNELLTLMTSYPGPFIPKLWEELVLKKIDCNIIFATAFPYDHIIPCYVASKKWKIPLIVAPLIHEDFPELYLTGLRLTILNNADAIIALTLSEKRLLENYGIDSKKIYLLPPGVEIQNDKLVENQFRKTHSIPQETKIILFVGSKSKVKGIIDLIEAMKILWEKNSDILLVTIGSTTPEFDENFSLLSPHFQNRILDLGVVDEKLKDQAFEACDIFILPSKSESFGMVYLEAWSFGKPVIGCKIKSSMELIDENKNGLLVEFGNINQLVKSLEYFLVNESLRKSFGQAGKEKLKNFNWTTTCNEFEKLCNLVITNYSGDTN